MVKPVVKPVVKPEVKPVVKPVVKPDVKPIVKPVAKDGTLIVETMMPNGSIVKGSYTSRKGVAGTEVTIDGPMLVDGYNLAYTTINGEKTTESLNNANLAAGKTSTIIYHLIKAKPVVKPMVAPTLNVENLTIPAGSTFKYSMLNAKVNENAQITYKGYVNTKKQGTYTVKVIATNSQGIATTQKVEVTIKGIIGFVSSNVNELNVRAESGSWSYKLGTLNAGTKVNIINQVDGWYKINYKDGVGYVKSSDINTNADIPTVASNVISTKVPYNMTMPEYVAGEIKEYKASVGQTELSKAQVTKLKNAINPKAAPTLFEFLNVGSYRNINEQGLVDALAGKGMLSGQAQNFINAAKEYNIDPIYFVSQSMLETKRGTSNFAKGITITEALVPVYKDGKLVYKNDKVVQKMKKLDKPVTVYNLFGVNANNSNPTLGATSYAYNHGWTSIPKAIEGAAKFLSTNYLNHTPIKQATPYELRYINGTTGQMWHQYASDIDYAKSIGNLINQYSYLYNSNDSFTFNTPQFKK